MGPRSSWGEGADPGESGGAARGLVAPPRGPRRSVRPARRGLPGHPRAPPPPGPPAPPAPAPAVSPGRWGSGSSAPPRGGKVGTWRLGTPPGAAGRLLGKSEACKELDTVGQEGLLVLQATRSSRSQPSRIRRRLANRARTKPRGSFLPNLALRLVSLLTCGFARLFGDFQWFGWSICFSFAL